MPGGPVSRQPLGSLPPSRVNCFGWRRYLTISVSSSLRTRARTRTFAGEWRTR